MNVSSEDVPKQLSPFGRSYLLQRSLEKIRKAFRKEPALALSFTQHHHHHHPAYFGSTATVDVPVVAVLFLLFIRPVQRPSTRTNELRYAPRFASERTSIIRILFRNALICFRHPHGRMASLILSHCKEAIIVSFIVAPILWFPTYFVFHINEKVDRHVPQYHVDANEDSFLFRSVKDSPRRNINCYNFFLSQLALMEIKEKLSSLIVL